VSPSREKEENALGRVIIIVLLQKDLRRGTRTAGEEGTTDGFIGIMDVHEALVIVEGDARFEL
jgi:hypothetical protein